MLRAFLKFSLNLLFLSFLIQVPCRVQNQAWAENNLSAKQIFPVKIPSGSCHTQGIALSGTYFYLTCVEIKSKRAWLYQIPFSEISSGNGEKINFKKHDLSEKGKYHPSGIDIKGSCLWVAVSEYHPAPAKSLIKCLEPFELKEKFSFGVDDHIGAISAMEQWIVGFNWDARRIYLFDYSGKLVNQGANPSKVAYQDCKHFSEKELLCSGRIGKFSPRSYLELLEIGSKEPEAWRVKKSFRLKDKSLAREGMAFSGESIYFFPFDFPKAKLIKFDLNQLLVNK